MSGLSRNTSAAQSTLPPTNNSPPDTKFNHKTLTLVLVASRDNHQDDHYAVIPFPETYEDAVATAIRVLGRYMYDPRTAVILRCSVKNRKDNWIWADILPEQWRDTLERNPMEVGVFEQSSPATFQYGHVHFVYHCPLNRQNTKWSLLADDPKALISQVISAPPSDMDRPEIFSNAIMQVKAKLRTIATGYSVLATDAKTAATCDVFKFYMFPNDDLRTWVAFPSAAYTDKDVWQAVVPHPGKILGVILSKSK